MSDMELCLHVQYPIYPELDLYSLLCIRINKSIYLDLLAANSSKVSNLCCKTDILFSQQIYKNVKIEVVKGFEPVFKYVPARFTIAET